MTSLRPADAWLEELGGATIPGAGPAAGLVGAAAAGLLAMVAHASRASWEDAGAVAAQAESLRTRAIRLAREDAAALDAFRAARREPAGRERPESRDFRLGQALARAADVPLAIAEAACDVALLAVHIAEHCEGDVRPDAVSAAMLASGAARSAAHLVEVNLATLADDERVTAARGLVRDAAAAAAAAERTEPQ